MQTRPLLGTLPRPSCWPPTPRPAGWPAGCRWKERKADCAVRMLGPPLVLSLPPQLGESAPGLAFAFATVLV